MSAKVCAGSSCSDGLSPRYESFFSDSTFNGCDDNIKDLPNVSDNDDFHTIQLLQSKIDVLNATITHQKFKFAQEYKEIKKHHQIRIDMLKKSAKKAEQAKPLVQPSRELLKMEEENRQLSSTISDLHQLLADQMARSSSENEQLRTTITKLQLPNQLPNASVKEEKERQMAEAKASRIEDLEMECRRLKSMVSKLQKKLAEEQERQKSPVENTNHLKVQLAACRSDHEDMRLTFKASSKQASDTIFNLRQQLSQTTKEQAKQVAKMRQELELIYEEKLRTAEKEKVNTEKEVKDCKKRIEALVMKLAVTNNKIKQSFVNQPVQNLNPKYFTMCRQSLENMIDSCKQRLMCIEKENLSLKLDKTIKEKEINVLKSNLAVMVKQHLRESREFEAEIGYVNVAAQMRAEENYFNKQSVSDAESARKRKSFSSPPTEQSAEKKAK